MLSIIILMVAITILVVLWWYCTPANSKPNDESNIGSDNVIETDPINPTIHSRCGTNTSCGGDLTCDLHCRRCKKKSGGDCATDIDCEFGLHCHNWKCTSTIPTTDNSQPTKDNSQPTSTTSTKDNSQQTPEQRGVKWNDDKNETYYI